MLSLSLSLATLALLEAFLISRAMGKSRAVQASLLALATTLSLL
jgi:hypothetical protein